MHFESIFHYPIRIDLEKVFHSKFSDVKSLGKIMHLTHPLT